jgi:hypothetical protein
MARHRTRERTATGRCRPARPARWSHHPRSTHGPPAEGSRIAAGPDRIWIRARACRHTAGNPLMDYLCRSASRRPESRNALRRRRFQPKLVLFRPFGSVSAPHSHVGMFVASSLTMSRRLPADQGPLACAHLSRPPDHCPDFSATLTTTASAFNRRQQRPS